MNLRAKSAASDETDMAKFLNSSNDGSPAETTG